MLMSSTHASGPHRSAAASADGPSKYASASNPAASSRKAIEVAESWLSSTTNTRYIFADMGTSDRVGGRACNGRAGPGITIAVSEGDDPLPPPGAHVARPPELRAADPG